MTEIDEIISRIKSIGYFLASEKNMGLNNKLQKQIEGKGKKLKSDILDLKLFDLNYNLNKLNKQLNQISMPSFTKIKLCVASSNTLAKERETIESFLFQKNDELVEKGIYISYNVWEKQSIRFNHTYKQEDFNEALVNDSEIFICLIGDDVGKFTREEFDKAYARFQQGEKPFVMIIFFKDFTDDEIGKLASKNAHGWARREDLKQYIQKDLNQFYGSFKNPEDLILHIDRGLEGDIKLATKI